MKKSGCLATSVNLIILKEEIPTFGGIVGMNKIVVIADLGHFKAYKLSKTDQGTGRLDIIESFDFSEARAKFSDKYSDQSGNFGGAVGKSAAATGFGETHGIAIEKEKRLVKNIAQFINKIIRADNCAGWYMAAVKTINNQVVAFLDNEVKAKLKKNISADLTKSPKSEIIKRFA
jgi:hypothetical protein